MTPSSNVWLGIFWYPPKAEESYEDTAKKSPPPWAKNLYFTLTFPTGAVSPDFKTNLPKS